MERTGNWISTYTGRQFYPLDPRPDDFSVLDIAHALSMLCRFGGHTKRFYSVAQHCVLMSRQVSSGDALKALLHDATEAYLVDLPRPIKQMLPEYRVMENRIMVALAERFGLENIMTDAVREADARMLITERNQLMHPTGIAWEQEDVEPYGILLSAWDSATAEDRYLDRLRELLPG